MAARRFSAGAMPLCPLVAFFAGALRASALAVDAAAGANTRLAAGASAGAASGTGVTINPYSQVNAVPAGSMAASGDAANSKKYLIASFPNLRQVAYCRLPDNVWRPLVIGVVTKPQGIAVDVANKRLFVADPDVGKIFWYTMAVRPDGLLMTEAQQYVAIEGFAAQWLAVAGTGDLYFTGKATVDPPQSSYDAVFKVEAKLIALGNTLSPQEVYTRSNSGNPRPKVWMPSGISVDSFYIYWGNQESGTQNCAMCRGPLQKVPSNTDASLFSLSTQMDDVRGVAGTSTLLLFVAPQGVFGVAKTSPSTATGQYDGLIAGPPSEDTNGQTFDPKSIAWDGDGTAYFSDFTRGIVYSVPASDLQQHNLTHFVDAPGVWGMAVANFDTGASIALRAPVLALCSVLVALMTA